VSQHAALLLVELYHTVPLILPNHSLNIHILWATTLLLHRLLQPIRLYKSPPLILSHHLGTPNLKLRNLNCSVLPLFNQSLGRLSNLLIALVAVKLYLIDPALYHLPFSKAVEFKWVVLLDPLNLIFELFGVNPMSCQFIVSLILFGHIDTFEYSDKD
jgi:hypothetical protein